MEPRAMKSFVVSALCFFSLPSLGGATPVAMSYAWKAEKLERFQRPNKDENATIACDDTSRSIVKHIHLHHRWVIEHFHDQEELQKLASLRIQSAEFGSSDKRYRFRISLESRQSSQFPYQVAQRTLALHSLTDNDSLSCKVRYDTTSAKDGSLHNLSEKVIYLKKTSGDMEVLEVALPYILEEYIDDDTLVILCSVTIFEQATTICDGTSPAAKENSRAFVDSFKKLLETKTSADLDIKASDCVIPAHRSILLARSAPMASLIEGNEKGYLLNATKFSCDSMNCVVSYIYTDKCATMPETAEEILVAAGEYELFGLKRMAETQLVRTLDEKNIASRAKFAKKTGSSALVRGVSDYIVRHRHVLSLDAWKRLEMEESCPTALLLREVILRT